ncbi:hypothetical protein [Planctomicrobium sp. SH664]|uniref:hypothetical protein n=1 Tax=Planctomicrobium sp. SH664 TaxID=3448125 RepID=UPI003F5BD907
MARNESDREDLYAELQSAAVRWELERTGHASPVVAGLRSGERFSIYFTPDCCFHFDSEYRLQRAFVDNSLYRTQGSTLARLVRVRTPEETQLLRTDLDPPALSGFLSMMRTQFEELQAESAAGNVRPLRSQGTGETDPLDFFCQALCRCLQADGQLAPAYPTRKQ